MKKIIYLIFLFIVLFNVSSCKKECEHEYATTIFEKTCEKDGYTLYHCNKCNDEYIADIVRTKGHQTIVTKKGYAATCTTPGLSDEITCLICQTKINQQQTIAPLEHKFITWKEIKTPTINETGILQSYCIYDNNHIMEAELPTLSKENNIYQYEVINPTCTKEGLETYQLTIEQQTFTYQVVLEKTPHTYLEKVTLPTCIDKGFTTYTCNCGDSYVDNYVNETGHSHTQTIVPPTCTKEGYTIYTCSCGDTYNDNITEKIPHEYLEEVIEPTCTKEGYTIYTCSCGDTYNDNITEKIPHEYLEEVIEPTCTKEGYTIYTCSCGDTYTDKVTEKIDHVYKDEVIDPKCEEQGYTLHTCECGDSYKDNYTDKLNHLYSDWYIKETPTETKEGILEKKCEHNETHIITEKLSVLSDQNYTVNTTNPTHENDGFSIYTFIFENEEYAFEIIIPALGHNYQTKLTLPTCEEIGYTTYKCDCGKTYSGDFIDPLGHNENILIAEVKPTCQNTGSTAKIECSRCHKIIQEQTTLAITEHQDLDETGTCDTCGVIVGEDIIYISTYEDLQKVNENLNGRYQLANDLDITDLGFVGIGSSTSPFTGYFFGNNHSIIGFNISNMDGALFYNNSGTIDSLILENITLSSDNQNATMGLLTCYNSGIIKNCIIKGNNKISSSVNHKDVRSYPSYDGGTYSYSSTFGAFAAKNSNEIISCSLQGSLVLSINNKCVYELKTPLLGYLVNGEDMQTNQTITFGAISGVNTGSIKESKVSGTVSAIYNVTAEKTKKYGLAIAYTTAYVGSFVGDNQGIIENSSATLIKTTDNVTSNDLHDSNIIYQYGVKCNLSKNYADGQTAVIGKNTGTISSFKYQEQNDFFQKSSKS